MKTSYKSSLSIVCVIYLLLTLTLETKATGLSGTYTICSIGCDYSNFTKAVSAINSQGVTGACIFDVDTGMYYEVITIASVKGVSSTNTITFRGSGAWKTKILAGDSGGVAVIYCNNANYVNFENIVITYDTTKALTWNAVQIYKSRYISFTNCRIFSPISSTGSFTVFNYVSDYIKFKNNFIWGGNYVVFNHTLTHCNFINNKMISAFTTIMYSYSTINNIYDGNIVDSSVSGGFGFFSSDENGANYINNQTPGINILIGLYANYPNFGSKDSFIIENNLFNCAGKFKGITGILLSYPQGKIAIRHNTVRICSPSIYTGFAYKLEGNFKVKIDLRNNNFQRNDSLNVVVLGKRSFYYKIEGNNYFNTIGTKTKINFNGIVYTSLSVYKSAAAFFGLGTNDTNQRSYFKDSLNLHYDYSKVNPHSKYCGVDYDIDGDKRSIVFPFTGGDEEGGPRAWFSFTTYNACIPVEVNFTNKSKFSSRYLWNFGNGDTSTILNPIYTYNNAGSYFVTLIAFDSSGKRDSFSKVIIIHQSSSNTVSVSSCRSYFFGGKTLVNSGIYYDTLVNVSGCDSIITLNLTINKLSGNTIFENACNSYVFGGRKLTSDGLYYDTLKNVSGCDSVITLNLTINSINNAVSLAGKTLTATETNATYQWFNCKDTTLISGETNQSFTPRETGNYADIVTKNGCVDTSICMFVQVTGNNELKIKNYDLEIFPIPTYRELNIVTSNPLDNASLKLTNITGHVITERHNLNNSTFTLNISELVNGIYFLELKQSGSLERVKVVKQ